LGTTRKSRAFFVHENTCSAVTVFKAGTNFAFFFRFLAQMQSIKESQVKTDRLMIEKRGKKIFNTLYKEF